MLKPCQKFKAEYTLIPFITGDLDLTKSYVLKTGGNATLVETDINAMSVPEKNKGTAPVL